MNIFVLLCFQAAFFTVSAIDEREAADDRVPPIDIANQEGGDIRAYGQQGIWNVYQDVDVKFFIPYVFDRVTDYKYWEVDNIRLAMEIISNNTCIRFRERRNEPQYFRIKNGKGGCYSNLGRTLSLEEHTIMLQSDDTGRCTYVKIVVHELIHAIGFNHEHNRYDRDYHVKIHMDNVLQNQTHNFQTVSQYESRTFGFPYDYHSIMHYGNTSFATDMTKLTMETLDRRYKGIIGNAYLPTESDYKRICLLYGCQGR
ncbi:hypothetical protein Aduo_003499 [Ancylostoma duodenale]